MKNNPLRMNLPSLDLSLIHILCKQNKINLMIEDKPENINTISKEIPVICYHANYNEQCNGKNIYRCYSWYDIYRKIKEM